MTRFAVPRSSMPRSSMPRSSMPRSSMLRAPVTASATARRPSGAAARPGVVLVAVLLALLLLALALAGTLAVATQEAMLGRVEAATLRARLGAEGAARAALAGWQPEVLGSLPPGGSAALPWASGTGAGGVRWEAAVERLSASRWRVTGEAVVGPVLNPLATGRTALLVATAPGPDLWAGLRAALTADGQLVLSGSAVLDAAAPPREPCGLDEAAVDAAGGGGPFPAIRLGEAGQVELASGATVQGGMEDDAAIHAGMLAAGLGPLGTAALASMADRLEEGALTLAPVADGATCSTAAAGNWGAPLDPAHPCAGYVPVIHAPGNLELVAGAGAALLVVAGDLVVRSGVELHGIILVLGNLTVDEGGLVRGAVRLAGARADVGGGVFRDACVLARTVRRSAIDARPFRPPGRWWLPSF
ncbi:MAG: hypothetical protein WEB88_07695 [Gemmatimonadota bacterium]